MVVGRGLVWVELVVVVRRVVVVVGSLLVVFLHTLNSTLLIKNRW